MAIPLWALMAAGNAGLGAIKSELVDKPAENRERANKATMMRYSPWTGLAKQAAEPTDEASAFKSAVTGGVQGAAMGQNIEKFMQDQKIGEGLQKILTPAERGDVPTGLDYELPAKPGADAVTTSGLDDKTIESLVRKVIQSRRVSGYA